MSEDQAKSQRGPLDLSYLDLLGIAGPANQDDKKLPAALELKKWLFERRLDYARNFFDHHAKQRMSMFQFFLIFVGFAIGGYSALLKDGRSFVAMCLGLFGAALTLCFLFLDRRNEELVHISEDVLESLECDPLFFAYDQPILFPRRRTWLGTMDVGKRETNGTPKRVRRPLGIFRRQVADQEGWNPSERGESTEKAEPYDGIDDSRYRHGKWLPLFQTIILMLFLFLAVVAWCPQLIAPSGS